VTEDHSTLGEQALLKSWLATAAELYPAAVLKEIGLYQPPRHGIRPPLPREQGLGVRFSRSHPFPAFTTDPEAAPDLRAEAFERFVRPLAAPAFEEALGVLRLYLGARSRVLDLYCGLGETTRIMAPLVPDGEVVAVEPEHALLQEAFQRTREGGLGNVAFFQGTSEDLPEDFERGFDVVFVPLSLHRYPDLTPMAGELFRVCGLEAYVFIVEPSPAWYRRASEILQANIGEPASAETEASHDPFPEAGALESSLVAAGFAHYCWEELLPGIGLSVAMK
jgi:ubiquinone/menaquinone biosynthesis C-methylase UbiE